MCDFYFGVICICFLWCSLYGVFIYNFYGVFIRCVMCLYCFLFFLDFFIFFFDGFFLLFLFFDYFFVVSSIFLTVFLLIVDWCFVFFFLFNFFYWFFYWFLFFFDYTDGVIMWWCKKHCRIITRSLTFQYYVVYIARLLFTFYTYNNEKKLLHLRLIEWQGHKKTGN